MFPSTSEAQIHFGDGVARFANEIAESDVVVFCRLVARSPTVRKDGLCTFEVHEFVKGARRPAVGTNENQLQAMYFGDRPLGSDFYICGVAVKNAAAGGPATYEWSTPTAVDAREMEYIRRVPRLPRSGPRRRLIALYGYLHDRSDLIRHDVYEEFAVATYAELRSTRAWMPHARLLQWIGDPATTTVSRRQYLRMLSVCGTRADLPTLRVWIAGGGREMRRALDLLIACELALAGERALPAIEAAFLTNNEADYTDSYNALLGIRYAVDDFGAISKTRAIHSLRRMLDRPQLADLVIGDLGRYADWSSAGRLMELCRSPDDTKERNYVRFATAAFLLACPTREGKALLAELTALEPAAVAKAKEYYPSRPEPVVAPSGCGKCACNRGSRATCRRGRGIGSSWKLRLSRFALCHRAVR